MKIAIPSYKRQNILINKTLKMLKQYGIENNEIDVFVANDEERNNYQKVLDDNINIIVGVVGMDKIRMFMSNYYDEGKEIVYIDDDIEKVERLVIVDGKKKLEEVDDLRKVIEEGFNLCKTNQYQNWGIYPVHNAFFMNDKVSTDLKYIIGAFYGVINDRECETRIVSHGEDYERTMRYYLKYNGVIRFNNYTIKTKYFSKGGMSAEFNNEREKYIDEEINKLKEHYPDMMTIKKKKNYNNPVLRDRRLKIKYTIV
jgi:cellulose synthase/poly-beta-1,6-N-acetylglucosamine synthase-like glycosyltransferase